MIKNDKIRILIGVGLAIISLFFSVQPGKAQGVIGNPITEQNQEDPILQSAGCGGKAVAAADADYEQQVVELVNQERDARDLPPLKRTQPLTDAARYHAADMVQDNYFGHDTYDRVGGSLTFVCGTWERIATFSSGATGENAAAGYGSPTAVMQGWMDSSGHRDNILNASHQEIGVGFYNGGGDYHSYWVQDFGRRSDHYPVIINREAATTDKRDVSLYIYGDWQEMRLRNDGGSWTNWQSFQPQLDWTIGPGAGEHTVQVELKDGGQTASSSDSIYLTSDAAVLGYIPENFTFIYSIPDERLYPAFQDITPTNMGNGDPLTWQVTKEGSFFAVNPSNSTSPDSSRITPNNFSTTKSGTHTGQITITVSQPSNVEGSPHTSQITLVVSNDKLYQVFMPGIQNK
jgi:uncharacterized protein YkwD